MLDLDITVTESRATDAALTYRDTLTRLVTGGYTFTSNVLGGHTRAEFNIGCSVEKAWQILNDHLGRRILVSSPYSPYTDYSVWEGTIYSVRIDDGRVAIGRSLEAVYNYILIADYTTGAAPTVTQDATSIALFGQRDLAVNTTATSASWAQIRRGMLAQYKDARPTQENTRRATGARFPEAIVKITAAGIWEHWGRRIYRSLSPDSHTSNWRLNEWLNSYANPYASSVRTYVQTNSTQSARKVATYTTVQTLVGQLCNLGDSSYKRWQFGFYENGNPYFEQEPSATAYRMSSRDKAERIIDAITGVEVPPYLVRPGRILEIPDIMPDSITYTSHLSDPRKMLIGEVTYTSPGGLSLSPQLSNPGQVRLDRLNQR